MLYRIRKTHHLGVELHVGSLFTDSGAPLGEVSAYSAAGALTALRRLAFKLRRAARPA